MNSLSLSFNEVNLNPVDRKDGQIWLTSAELSKALGYADIRSITNIFNRNKDEFTGKMTEVINLITSNNLKRSMRIFSLRGCHLIAMFAKTDIAKEFRKWVLDILDKETRTDSKQRECLITACDKLAVGNTLRSDVYTMVANHFGYEKVTQIPAPLLPEAVAFVYGEILARQKYESKSKTDCKLNDVLANAYNDNRCYLDLIKRFKSLSFIDNEKAKLKFENVLQHCREITSYADSNNLLTASGKPVFEAVGNEYRVNHSTGTYIYAK
ncbi:Bro-N domain-containing protein [Psychrobacter sp. I-STPA6b]|uniref:BRO-N domain-containing protein n=1 Tax=Psychrobacter sp. I-STPA6b TaxID=2585718 RepID=UPI001D0CC288|nr:BRO family protein [Psychrobacter sp. I-STPA6b]